MPATNEERAKLLRYLAEIIRRNPNNAQAIANGFDVIADAMQPCHDCGHHDAKGGQ